MSPRARIVFLVAVVAAVAATVVVGGAILASSGDEQAPPPPPVRPQAGRPPLALDLGLRDDARTRALARAAKLYEQGSLARARAIFGRYGGVPAEIGAAFASWPDATIPALRRIVADHPRNALARLNLGLALYWSGHSEAAFAAWRAARTVEPDSRSAIHASDLLHPKTPPGLPLFVPSFPVPRRIQELPPDRQLAALARDARTGGLREKLLYGVGLERIGRPVSAERAFADAVRAAPRDLEAQVALAVARFRKERPERAFARLGPLARAHPRSVTVRFHLGLLLIWLGDLDDAKRELRLARAAGPASRLGREANRFLARLEGGGKD